MAFKEIQSLQAETTVQLGNGPNQAESIEGYYLGYKEVDNDLNPTEPAKLHIFSIEGKNVGVWGKSIMNNKLASVPAPSNPNKTSDVAYLTTVTFLGLKPSYKKGRHPAKNFSVGYDDQNFISVSTLESGISTGEDNSIDAEDFVDDAPVATPPPTPTRTAIKAGSLTKEHANSVTNMLKRK